MFLSTQQQEKRTSILPKEQNMITSVFVITIYLSELGLADIYFLSTVDFLSTVRGDYCKGEFENILFVYENIKYRTTSLLCRKPYWIPSHGC